MKKNENIDNNIREKMVQNCVSCSNENYLNNGNSLSKCTLDKTLKDVSDSQFNHLNSIYNQNQEVISNFDYGDSLISQTSLNGSSFIND